MRVYLEYGHKCNDNANTVVTQQLLSWRWSWFFISETIKDIFREIKFCRKMKYTFFIHRGNKNVR